MTRARSLSRGFALCVALGVVSALVFPGCSEDGQTASCPPLERLYDVSEAGERNAPEVQEFRARALEAGCITALDETQLTPPGSGGDGS